MRRRMVAAAVAAVLAAGCSGGDAEPRASAPAAPPAGSTTPAASATATPRPSAERPPLPTVMAAVGDSMTRAFNLCEGITDCPEESWSTGTRTESHYARLRALGARLTAHNLAVSGSTVSSLPDQARRAVATGADYVTVLIGANDACTGRADSMTPVAAFAAAFERGLDTLVRGLPDARVLVVSVPDLMRLWEVGRDVPAVRERWDTIRVCQSMLADPLSNDAPDVARRARVKARVEAYNAAMARACARYRTCRWDGGAVYAHRFGVDAVSERDGWHPSRVGQRILADVSWRAGWWG